MAITFVGSLGLAVAVRQSHTDHFTPEAIDNADLWYTMPYDPINDEGYREMQKQDLGAADIVVRVTVLDEMILKYSSMSCMLKILDVYKGDVSVGETIEFYEPNFFALNTETNKVGSYNNAVTTMMKEGEEYILFACRNKSYCDYYTDYVGYKVYNPASYVLTYFAVRDLENKLTLAEDGEVTFKEIKDSEFVFFWKQDEISITRYKKAVMKKFASE